jgi:Na+/melibiose symporter-like transporter
LFQKVALAVAVAISNFVLSSSGYISPEAGSLCANPEQPESTKFVLSLMIGIFPAAIMALSLIALAFYPITK